MLRPSSLDILSQCSQYESKGGNEYTDAGTLRHEAIQAYYEGFKNESALAELSLDDQESVKWAVDQLELFAPVDSYVPEFEQRLKFKSEKYQPWLPNGGQIDIRVGNFVIDIKSRPRVYYKQMLAYACLIFDNHPDINNLYFYLLFTESRSIARYTFHRHDAFTKLEQVITSINEDESCNRCDYCGWCRKVATCPEYLEPAKAIYKSWHGKEAEFLAGLKIGDKIDDPDQLGELLDFAKAVETWAEAIKDYANEKANVDGIIPTGFKMIERAGSRFVTDIIGAYENSRLQPSEFIELCSITFGKIVDAYRQKFELTKSQAEKQVAIDLQSAIATGKSTTYLRQIKPSKSK